MSEESQQLDESERAIQREQWVDQEQALELYKILRNELDDWIELTEGYINGEVTDEEMEEYMEQSMVLNEI